MPPIKAREDAPVFPPIAEIPARHVERKMDILYANICKSYVNKGLLVVRDDSWGGEHQGGDTGKTQGNKGGGAGGNTWGPRGPQGQGGHGGTREVRGSCRDTEGPGPRPRRGGPGAVPAGLAPRPRPAPRAEAPGGGPGTGTERR